MTYSCMAISYSELKSSSVGVRPCGEAGSTTDGGHRTAMRLVVTLQASIYCNHILPPPRRHTHRRLMHIAAQGGGRETNTPMQPLGEGGEVGRVGGHW